MAKYYYFCAGLPGMHMDEKPPWTPADFLENCRRLLNTADFRQVRLLMEEAAEGGGSFISAWRAWETQLLNAVARWRAGRLGVDVSALVRPHAGYDCSLEKQVGEACALSDPLERERALDRLRWRRAESGAWSDPFGLPAVLAFAVKLRLAWRWAALDEDKARAAVDDFVQQAVAD